MRAEIKKIFSLDVKNLVEFVPDNPSNFSIPLRLVIGPAGETGEETFDVDVCTPEWLMQHFRGDSVVLLRHKILVNSFDFARIKQFIERYVRHCEGDDWNDVAQKLSRLGRWEFEDYRA
jgi:hypothetical protein